MTLSANKQPIKLNPENKAKKGVKEWMEELKIKRYFTILAFTIILISSLINVINQFVTIIKAKNENYSLDLKLQRLEEEKMTLEEKIKEATSPAYLQGQQRELLGMGSKDDYWVIEPKNINTESIYPKLTVGDEKTNLEKWIELFTD